MRDARPPTHRQEEHMLDTTRRDLLQNLATLLPMIALMAHPRPAMAQAPVPVKVDTHGLVAKIKFEHALQGYRTDLHGKHKLTVGEHNHLGPGIRLVTFGEMPYVLPEKTIIYKPGDFFFESGDVNHTVYNKSDKPNQHLLFEILPVELQGPWLIPVKGKTN